MAESELEPQVGQIMIVGEHLQSRLSNGQVVQFQRYCPHLKHDLSLGSIKDDKITCPRHKWCFDLQSGELLTKIPPAMYSIKPILQCSLLGDA
jgi:nitrite reductase/ring-hydroxylating ferredoxin subunit